MNDNQTATNHHADGPDEGPRSRRRLTLGLGTGALALVAAAFAAAQVVGPDDSTTATSQQAPGNSPRDGDDSGTSAASGPAEMCAAELFFKGNTYTQAGTGQLVEGAGDAIGTATVPPCNDTPGQEQADDAITTVEVSSVDAGPGGSSAADLIYADGAVWSLVP